jgi:hypothetical protein
MRTTATVKYILGYLSLIFGCGLVLAFFAGLYAGQDNGAGFRAVAILLSAWLSVFLFMARKAVLGAIILRFARARPIANACLGKQAQQVTRSVRSPWSSRARK